MMRTLGTLLFATTLLAGSLAGQSYYSSYTAEGTTPPGIAPGSPASSYALSGFDTISLFGGKLNFALPLFTSKGRGEAGYTAMLRLDPGWSFKAIHCMDGGCAGSADYIPVPDWWSGQEVGYGPGVVLGRVSYDAAVCYSGVQMSYAVTRFTFIEPNGTEHELRDTGTNGEPRNVVTTPPDCYSVPFNRGRVFASYEGEAMTFETDSDVQDTSLPLPDQNDGPRPPLEPSGTLYFADGRKYDVVEGQVTRIRDRNGNTLEFEYGPDGNLTAVSEPNRTIRFDLVSPCDEQEPGEPLECQKILISPAGSSTPFQTIRIYRNSLSATGVTIQSNYELFQRCGPAQNESCLPLDPWSTPIPFNPTVVTKVRLPNGTYYRFSYNAYGDVAAVQLPTGGRVEYTYDVIGATGTGMAFRRVTQRREYDEISRLRLSSNFSYSDFTSGTTTTTTVTDSDSQPPDYGSMQAARKTVHVFSGLPSIVPIYYLSWMHGRETTTEARKPSDDSLSRRTAQDWQNRLTLSWWLGSPWNGTAETAPSADPRMIRATTWLEGATKSSKVEYDYDAYNNITTTRNFDFDQSTASRWVNRTFETSTSYTSIPVHLRRLPKTESIVGTSGQEAYTNFDYDQGTPVSASGTYWENPSSYRGNPTAMRRQYSGRDVTTSKTFDVLGNVRTLTEPLDSGEGINRVTQFAYDACQGAYLTQITNAKSQTASWTYNDCALGKPSGHTDTNGAAYAYTYSDPLLRLTGVSEAGGLGQITYAYDIPAGTVNVTATRQQDSCSSPDDIITKTDYDGFGRPVKERTTEAIDAIYTYVDTLYDGFGNVARKSDPYRTTPPWTQNTYDELGRILESRRLDDNSVTTLNYTLEDTLVTDPAGVQRKSKTDALGRLTQVIENPSAANPQDRTTAYTYNARDLLLSATQGTQPARSFGYDSLGRLTSAVNPENGTTAYTYYDNGNLFTKTDADSIVVTSAWDPLNRLKGKSYSSGAGTPAVTYCYDGDTSGGCAGAPSGSPGNLTMVTNGSYTTRYPGYDGLRRVTASSQQFSSETPYAFSYGYNMAGGLELETFPSNRHVRTCYDKAGRPKQVRNPDNSHNYAEDVQYAAHGAMTSALLGSGITESWGYTRMQPTTMSAGSLLSMTMNYGLSVNNGNLLSRTIDDGTVFTQSFGYTDGLNRLTTFSESGTGLSQTYQYDRWGNRAVTAGWVPATGLTPQALTAYNTNTNRWTGTGVDYDNRGNQTALPSRTFAYDAESRLKTATYLTETTDYAYDGEGRRVKKTVNGVETRFVYDALGRLAAEYTTAAPTSQCATCYLIADHLGSTRLVTGPTGALVKRYDYVPFGEEIPAGQFNRGTLYSTGSYPAAADSATAIKFTGKERDAETGLDYFGARYFSAAQGRFTSPDPTILTDDRLTDPQQWNLYSYTRNNPLKYVDPNGRDLRIAVTNQVAGQSYVNQLPGGRSVPGQISQAAPLYRMTIENDSGTTAAFSVTRDSNVEGPIENTRGSYGPEHEAPPGEYVGTIRTDGARGFRIQLSDEPGQSTITAPDGTVRTNVQIHVGPGCSEGCMLLPGGKAGRDAFANTVTKMVNEDKSNNKGTAIQVNVQDRNQPSAAESRRREAEARRKKEEENK